AAEMVAVGAAQASVDLVQRVRPALGALLATAERERRAVCGVAAMGRRFVDAVAQDRFKPAGQDVGRNLVARGIEEAALHEDLLEGVADGGDLGVMEARR